MNPKNDNENSAPASTVVDVRWKGDEPLTPEGWTQLEAGPIRRSDRVLRGESDLAWDVASELAGLTLVPGELCVIRRVQPTDAATADARRRVERLRYVFSPDSEAANDLRFVDCVLADGLAAEQAKGQATTSLVEVVREKLRSLTGEAPDDGEIARRLDNVNDWPSWGPKCATWRECVPDSVVDCWDRLPLEAKLATYLVAHHARERHDPEAER